MLVNKTFKKARTIIAISSPKFKIIETKLQIIFLHNLKRLRKLLKQKAQLETN